MTNSIIIGTRGSALALYQANRVKQEIESCIPGINATISIIKTKGDKILDVALAKIGDKGLFTKELEEALLNKSIDVAVHSLKDLPTQMPLGICLGAVLERGEVRDVLISNGNKKMDALTPDDVIATSSLRRKAQLLAMNPDLQIIDIRGNVDSRVRKMEEGYCDALILAGAGVMRLEKQDKITEFIDKDLIIPAVSQGIIGLEIRENDETVKNVMKIINHPQTWVMANAEREFLRTLQGGCQVPMGCYSEISDTTYKITGFISELNGSKMIKNSSSGPIAEAIKIAKSLALWFYNNGGKEILENIRKSYA